MKIDKNIQEKIINDLMDIEEGNEEALKSAITLVLINYKREIRKQTLEEVEKIIEDLKNKEINMKTEEDEYTERARALEILDDLLNKLGEMKK